MAGRISNLYGREYCRPSCFLVMLWNMCSCPTVHPLQITSVLFQLLSQLGDGPLYPNDRRTPWHHICLVLDSTTAPLGARHASRLGLEPSLVHPIRSRCWVVFSISEKSISFIVLSFSYLMIIEALILTHSWTRTRQTHIVLDFHTHTVDHRHSCIHCLHSSW